MIADRCFVRNHVWLETSIVSGSFSGQRGAGHASLLPDDLLLLQRRVFESSGHSAHLSTDRRSANTDIRRVADAGPLCPILPTLGIIETEQHIARTVWH